jgi:hypothetical protein
VDCSKKQVASGQSPKAKLGIMSYKNLEIWQLAREIALEVHKMTLEDLPKFEMRNRATNQAIFEKLQINNR